MKKLKLKKESVIMYRLSENKIDDFLYSGSRLIDANGNEFEYVRKLKELYCFYDTANEEEVFFTFSEMRQLYGIAPIYYHCEYSHGKNVCECTEWFPIATQKYMELDAWEAVTGAMDWLEWDYMDEKEKSSIFIKLWRSDNILVGVFDVKEVEAISCGEYEPWKEL